MTPNKLDDTTRNLILRAMVSMAAAARSVEDVETATICTIFEKVTGESVEAGDIAGPASEIAADDAALTVDLAAARNTLDTGAKEAVVRAAYLVLVSDGRVAGPERKKLTDIANALKMPEYEVSAILEELESSVSPV